MPKTALANFKPWSPPKANIHSPLPNVTYCSNVPLAITVVVTGYGPWPDEATSLFYSLDWKPDVALAYENVSYPLTDMLSGLSDGVHTLVVSGSTSRGYYFSTNVTFTVNSSACLENNKPLKIGILFPENETYVGMPALNFWVSKPIAWAEYSVNNNANITVLGNVTRWFCPSGPNNVTVFAVDITGNISSETAYFNIVSVSYSHQYNQWLLTPTTPVINVTSPSKNAIYNDSNIPLTFITGQFNLNGFTLLPYWANYSTKIGYPNVSWVGYSLDGKSIITIKGNTTLTGLPEGTHNITVFANDTLGNFGASPLVHFTTDVTEFNVPGLSWLIILPLLLAVLFSTIMLRLKKRREIHE